MNKGTKKIAVGTLVAGVVGYLAGILTAPKSGQQTRNDIKTAGNNGIVEGEKQLKKLHTELSKLLDEAGDEGKKLKTRFRSRTDGADADDAVEKAKNARQKTREIISAIHDGSADDRDLDKAVNEAHKAIKAIRNYLKK